MNYCYGKGVQIVSFVERLSLCLSVIGRSIVDLRFKVWADVGILIMGIISFSAHAQMVTVVSFPLCVCVWSFFRKREKSGAVRPSVHCHSSQQGPLIRILKLYTYMLLTWLISMVYTNVDGLFISSSFFLIVKPDFSGHQGKTQSVSVCHRFRSLKFPDPWQTTEEAGSLPQESRSR